LALLRDTFQALIITHHEKRRSGKMSISWKREHQFGILKIKLRLTNWQWFSWYTFYYKFLCVTMSAHNRFLISIYCFLLSDFCDTFRHFVTSNILPFHAHMNQCGELLRKVLLVIERIVFYVSGFVVWCIEYFRGFNLPLTSRFIQLSPSEALFHTDKI